MYSTSRSQSNSKTLESVNLILMWLGVGNNLGRTENRNHRALSGFGVQYVSSIFSQFITYLRTAFFRSAPPERFAEALILICPTLPSHNQQLVFSRFYGTDLQIGFDHHIGFGPPPHGYTPFRSEHSDDGLFLSDNRLCRKKLLLTKGSKPESPLQKMANLLSSSLRIRNTNAQSGISSWVEFGGLCRAFKPRS